mmetsp:Transcript_46368/g.129269  ORF Transcript_46368/g.129269 Transcript_46368/m.129269 type:complete len:129 (+) Transcript_46368:1-387(+)
MEDDGADDDAAPAGSAEAPRRTSGQRRRDALERRLERRTMDELRKYLKLNGQFLGGTKPELIRRVADGVLLGALPACPVCGGHLHPDDEACASLFRCRKTNRDREPCGYEVSVRDVERRPFMGAEQLL